MPSSNAAVLPTIHARISRPRLIWRAVHQASGPQLMAG
jgi:hypothetical protein